MTVFNNFEQIIELNKKYSIIYADAPRQYKDKALAGERGSGCKYDVMSDNDICNLPVNKISNDNCILFFWGTWPLEVTGSNQKIIESWGFTPKTCAFVWIKKYFNNKIFFGMGNWTRSNSEFIILATKGNPKRIDAGISQVIETIPKQHSEKPNIFRQKILELCGNLSRIELFARQHPEGWDVLGNDKNLHTPRLTEFQNQVITY